MKMPICDLCLRSNTLCKRCEKKLREKKITELDIEMARTLYAIDRRYGIGNVTFKKSFESDGLIVMMVGKGDVGNIVGKRGKIIRILKRKFNKKIRVIEETDNIKELVAEIISPARVTGMNIIYPVSGSAINKIRIDETSKDKMPADVSVIEDIVKRIIKKDIKIVLE